MLAFVSSVASQQRVPSRGVDNHPRLNVDRNPKPTRIVTERDFGTYRIDIRICA
jgi:hypothetical protein